MLLGFILLLGPIGLYLALAALPPGRAARGAFGAAAAGLGALWLCRLWALPPFTGVARADDLATWALGFWSLAWASALVPQALRGRIGATGLALGYPLAVGGVLALALAVLLPITAL